MSSAASSGLPMHQRRSGSRNSSNNSSSDMYGRSSGGYSDVEGGRGRGGGRMGSSTNAGIMESQNNERINELSDQVARLKGLTIEIGNEVREQNSFLDGMGDGFEGARDMLQGSLRKIGTMLESGGTKHMCYMVIFCVVVILFLWWLMTYKGTSGA